MNDGRGGRFDFRGKDGSIYNLLSTERVSFNALFKTADFKISFNTDAGPKQRLVHGSFINSVFFFAHTDRGTVQAEYDATRAVFIYVGNNTATPTKHRAPFEIDFGGLTVSLDNRVAKFTTATWTMRASSKYKEGILGRGSSCSTGKCFLEVTVKPLADADNAKVAPHGLIGQAFDGADVSFIGKTDEYKGTEITTSAMGEGAIEGVADDYEVLGKFDTAFKFSRWGLSTAQPRDSSQLTGDKVKRGKLVGAASASEIFEYRL